MCLFACCSCFVLDLFRTGCLEFCFFFSHSCATLHGAIPCATPFALFFWCCSSCNSFHATPYVLSFLSCCYSSHLVAPFVFLFFSCCHSSRVATLPTLPLFLHCYSSQATIHALFLLCGSSHAIPVLLFSHRSFDIAPFMLFFPLCNSRVALCALQFLCYFLTRCSLHVATPMLLIICCPSQTTATIAFLTLQHLSHSCSSWVVFLKYLLA